MRGTTQRLSCRYSKDRGNYRLLSLLSVPSKLVEDVIGNGLNKNIAEIGTATSNQWGYKKGTSSETLLLYLTEKWKFALDDKKVKCKIKSKK